MPVLFFDVYAELKHNKSTPDFWGILGHKVGNLYDYSFKVGNKCRLIIDKQEFIVSGTNHIRRVYVHD
jgi:hypothetical protein